MTLARLMIAFAGSELPRSAVRLITERGVAGVTLFRLHNVVDPPQIRRLTAAIQAARPVGAPPLLVAADQEGGQLVGLGDGTTPFAGPMALGAAGDAALAERVAGAMARELRAVGVNVNYAPTCDVASNPANPALGIRSFGDDPVAVGGLAAATVRGLQGEGVAATAKHFPGAGDTASDPHHELPLVPRTTTELAERELVPFRAALDAGVRMVMTGHLRLPDLPGDLPTSLSAAVLRDLLRGQLRFDGVTVTDALDMHALAQGSAQIVDAIAALRAGEDVLLGTVDDAARERLAEGLAQAQRRGLIDADDDAAATRRLGELRRWLGEYDQPPLDVVGCADHQALAAELAQRSITLVRDDDRLLPLRPAADTRIAVVQSKPADLTPADTSATVRPTLASALRRRHAGWMRSSCRRRQARPTRRSRRAARGRRPRRPRDVRRAPAAGAGDAGRGGPGVRHADRHRRPAHAVGPARLSVGPNPRLQLRHPAAVDGGTGGRAAGRGAVRGPAAGRHPRPASTRSRTHRLTAGEPTPGR